MLIRELVRRLARSVPDRTAYIDPNRTVSWSEVHDRSRRLAGALEHLGMAKGDRTAILAYDHVEVLEHWLACAHAGFVRTGVNWRYAEREMRHVLDDAAPSVVVIGAECIEHVGRDLLASLAASDVTLVGYGEGHGLKLDLEQLIAAGHEPSDVMLEDDDILALSYTSGSTGLPKGVQLTHRGAAWQLASAPASGGIRPDDVVLNNLPMPGFPIYLSSYALSQGAATVIPGRFDPDATVRLLVQHGVSVMIAVPTMLPAIIDAVGRAGTTPRLRTIILLGSPSTPSIQARAQETFRCEVQNWYGSTETNGAICMLRDSDRAEAPELDLSASVGRPLLHVDFAVIDDDGRELPRGEIGEIAARGPLLAGYRNNEAETRRALGDGWVRTGDIGRQDEHGFVFLQDR